MRDLPEVHARLNAKRAALRGILASSVAAIGAAVATSASAARGPSAHPGALNANDYTDLGSAIAASQGRTLTFPPGIHVIDRDVDFGSASVELSPGAILRLARPDVTVTIRRQLVAGNYKCLETVGDFLLGGDVNPVWFGAMASVETLDQARVNTSAFRCAAKSYTNSMAKIVKAGLAFSVRIPAGVFALANGFTVSAGVSCTGAGASDTWLKRLTPYMDKSEPEIPLLTVGKTMSTSLSPNLQADVSPMANFGAPQTLGLCADLYFTDQSSAGALKANCPGVQLRDLFFTACATSLIISSGDITAHNIIVDMGLTGIYLTDCQNVILSSVLLYNIKAQAIAFGGACRDVVVDGLIIEYPEYLGIVFPEGTKDLLNIQFNNFSFFMNEQYPTFQGMVVIRASTVDASFSNGTFRNIKGPAIVNSSAGANTRFGFTNVTFDGLRTGDPYKQGSTMTAMSAVSGSWSFTGCRMRNLSGASKLSKAATLRINDLHYERVAGGKALFDVRAVESSTETPMTAHFMAVVGDGVTPVIDASRGDMFVQMKSCTDVMGPPTRTTAGLSWMIPLGLASAIQATVTAKSASLRSTASFIVEKSIDYSGTDTDEVTLTRVIGRDRNLIATIKFDNGSDSQPSSQPRPTRALLTIPASYLSAQLQVEWLSQDHSV